MTAGQLNLGREGSAVKGKLVLKRLRYCPKLWLMLPLLDVRKDVDQFGSRYWLLKNSENAFSFCFSLVFFTLNISRNPLVAWMFIIYFCFSKSSCLCLLILFVMVTHREGDAPLPQVPSSFLRIKWVIFFWSHYIFSSLLLLLLLCLFFLLVNKNLNFYLEIMLLACYMCSWCIVTTISWLLHCDWCMLGFISNF